jgi:predicted TIM-barrel fold metal-dependent hydrolase
MIIDGHVHITDVAEPVWGWPPFTADDLVALMDEPIPVGIGGASGVVDQAVVMPALGLTTRTELSFRQQHEVVIDAVRRYPGRLVGNFVFNVRMGVEKGIEELRRLVADDGFRMVKLHPTMHNFWPGARELTYPVLEEAAALGIPVLVHMGEPPYSVPALLEPVAKDHPDVTIILGHFGTQKICYADDAVNVARHCPNIMIETGWGPLPRLLEGVRALGPGRFVFGSDSPPQEIYSQLRVVQCLSRRPPLGLNLGDEDVEAIMGGNLARLLSR